MAGYLRVEFVRQNFTRKKTTEGNMKKDDRIKLVNTLFFTLFFLAIIWIIFLAEEHNLASLKQFGVHPRSSEKLIGIWFHPFLHGGWDHIIQNSTSFLVLNSMLFFYYRQLAWKVTLVLFLFTGPLLWLISSGGNHIGASGVIYGLAAFVFFSGILRDFEILLRVSLVVAFIYGSIVWYIFPVDVKISWEGHLSGAVLGFILAIYYRKAPPQRPKYRYEIEEEIEAQIAEEEAKNPTVEPQYFYTYIPKPEDNEDLVN